MRVNVDISLFGIETEGKRIYIIMELYNIELKFM